jgi:hypothetical protein
MPYFKYTMPNDCFSEITIVGNKDDLDVFEKERLRFSYFFPEPTRCNNVEWRLENWGEKYDNDVPQSVRDDPGLCYKDITVKHRSDRVLVMKMWTPWAPPLHFLKRLVTSYPQTWLKVSWHEGGGLAGVCVASVEDGELQVKEIDWLEPYD